MAEIEPGGPGTPPPGDTTLNPPGPQPPPGGGGSGSPFQFVSPGVVRRGTGSVYGRKVYGASSVYDAAAQPLQNQDGGSMVYSGGGGSPYDYPMPTAGPTGLPQRQASAYTGSLSDLPGYPGGASLSDLPGYHASAASQPYQAPGTYDPGLPPPVQGKMDSKYRQRWSDWSAAHQAWLDHQDQQYLGQIKTALSEARNGALRRAQLGSDIYGNNDPLAAMYGQHKAETAANDQYPGLLAQAYSGWLQSRAQMSFQEYLARLQAKLQSDAQPKFDWGALGGQVAGAAVGAVL